MKFTAYRLRADVEQEIRPATVPRDWMDQSQQRFAYRCLPLNIANSFGWDVLTSCAFEVLWSGRPGLTSVSVVPDDPSVPSNRMPCSHFGEGVLTFRLNYLFRTPPGINLYVGGPPNVRKDGITPLTGVVETDWLPYPFTMNWVMTRPGVVVRFERGEPFCRIFPLPRGLVDGVEPMIVALESDPEMARAHQAWVESRSTFLRDLSLEGSTARADGWQRHYMRATHPDGAAHGGEHQTKLRVQPFEDRTGPMHGSVDDVPTHCPMHESD